MEGKDASLPTKVCGQKPYTPFSIHSNISRTLTKQKEKQGWAWWFISVIPIICQVEIESIRKIEANQAKSSWAPSQRTCRARQHAPGVPET
jgi:hypothetical protein